MHLSIDVREACTPMRTGKGQWTYGFVSELLRRDHTCVLYTHAPIPAEWKKIMDVDPQRCTTTVIPQRGLLWHLIATRRFLQSSTEELYISPVSYIVPFLVGKRKRVVPVVHDLIAFHDEPHDRKAKMIERFTLKRAASFAARVCTVSESTKNDLLKEFPGVAASKVSTIFAGPVTTVSGDAHPDGKTVLCISTLCPRKNQLRLIQAYASLPPALRERSRLVLVGKRGWDDEEIVRLAQTTPGVEWKKYLSDDACAALFQSCTVFAFPSLYEGFGMPLLDAFRHGVPVLASDRGSLQEVAGDAALLIDPESVQSIASGLERLLTDASLRADLIQKGRRRAEVFSWKRTVDLFLKAVTS